MARLFATGLLASLYLVGLACGDETPETFFELKVRPVLATTCLPCHGGKKTSSGLKVDSRESLLRGGSRGPAIVPGEPAKSLLIQAVRRVDDDLKMPPDRPLSDESTKALAKWVAQGAAWPKETAAKPAPGKTVPRHWAFQRIKVADPPADPTGWSTTPIDRLLAARRRSNGLSPVHRADRRTLIRRVTFDLIGLPPTPEEIADFLADRSRVPSLGSSTACWPLRITASTGAGTGWTSSAMPTPPATMPTIRSRKPFAIATTSSTRSTPTSPMTRFVREQLAGDILARSISSSNEYSEAVIATGFLALSRRYATAPYRALAPDARRHDRHHRPGVSGADSALRPLPRPQVRPGHPARLLRPLRHLRQHHVSLRRLGGVAIEGVSADEFRAAWHRRATPKREARSAIEKRLAELERQAKRLESKTDPGSRTAVGPSSQPS